MPTEKVIDAKRQNSSDSTTPAAPSSEPANNNRRGFIKTGTAISASVAGLGAIPAVHGQDAAGGNSDTVKLAMVGCGGRGGGAVNDTMSSMTTFSLSPWLTWMVRNSNRSAKALAKRHEDKVKVSDNKMYSGIDAYRRVLDDPDVDVVLFATPPGFRPQYIAEAVDAGKHVFAEKPTCVDPAGFKICLTAHEQAVANGTAIVTGTQYRRQTNYVEAIKRIHGGEIGDIVAATSRYCSTGIWNRIRKPGMSDTEYQIFNWMHFIWLSGDQIAEQAVHNIDTMNWIMGGPPESAYGSGGRFTRPEEAKCGTT